MDAKTFSTELNEREKKGKGYREQFWKRKIYEERVSIVKEENKR